MKGFRATMSGTLSAKDFSKLAGEYFKSPDYNRWKAAHEAEQLRAHREGREHLMNMIEQEKKAGTPIDYETVPIKDGHDSICVLMHGKRTVCFPSFFCKESVDMNWTHVMEAKNRRSPCGAADCSTSTAIDDKTITFGRGKLDDLGFWEIPCVTCADAFKKAYPKTPVWPVQDAPK